MSGFGLRLPLPEPLPDRAKAVEEAVLTKEDSRKLAQMIDSLGEPDRSIFLSKYFYYETADNIARRFGLTVKAVENRLFRARKAVRQQFRDGHGRRIGMRNSEEKQMYRLLDRLEQEESGRLTDKIHGAAEPADDLDPEALASLKRRTLEKLGLEPVTVTAESEITLKLGYTEIGPLRLVEPRTGEELQDLGRAATANGIKVAAVVTPLSGSMMKVNLLSQLPQGVKLDSYGLQPINSAIRSVLSDETGKAVDIPPDSGFVKAAEFDFEDASQGKSRYTLSIPYLRVVDTAAPFQKVTVPVPAVGASADLSVTATLAGFPVDFYRIERADASIVRIYADVHYSADAPAALHDFRVDMKDTDRQSYSWKVKDDTRAVDMLRLDILPDMKELTFYIGEPWILLKGPWNIDLGQMPATPAADR